MSRPGDNRPPEHHSRDGGPEPWSQRDLDMLHDMIHDYENARWFRRQAKWWALWTLGLPAVILSFWDPIEKLIKLIRGH